MNATLEARATGRREINKDDTKKMKRSNPLLRATIFLPKNMALNLAAMALTRGESQATIIREALAIYMKKAGYDPYKKPIIKVTHKGSPR